MRDKTDKNLRVLFFGDIVGKAGRSGAARQLPIWKKEFKPDVIIANVENIAHGFGIAERYLTELRELGVQIMTGGNHIIEGRDVMKILEDKNLPIIRPYNSPASWPGKGFITKKFSLGGAKSKNETGVTVINLLGQHGMKQYVNSPYEAIETLLKMPEVKQSIVIVDWHAETTSEKIMLGWYLDGRVAAVLGTHTHVPTADERILPGGTALISDVGMNGAYDSVIGIQVTSSIERIAKQLPVHFEVEESGPIEVNAVLIDIDTRSKKALAIRRLRTILPA